MLHSSGALRNVHAHELYHQRSQVNKIRECPSHPAIVVTHTDAPQLYVWHVGRQRNRLGDKVRPCAWRASPALQAPPNRGQGSRQKWFWPSAKLQNPFCTLLFLANKLSKYPQNSALIKASEHNWCDISAIDTLPCTSNSCESEIAD